MTSSKDRAIVVSALKHAAPYIRLFKGKVFVLKAGGEIFADPAQTSALMEQVGILHQVGGLLDGPRRQHEDPKITVTQSAGRLEVVALAREDPPQSRPRPHDVDDHHRQLRAG